MEIQHFLQPHPGIITFIFAIKISKTQTVFPEKLTKMPTNVMPNAELNPWVLDVHQVHYAVTLGFERQPLLCQMN